MAAISFIQRNSKEADDEKFEREEMFRNEYVKQRYDAALKAQVTRKHATECELMRHEDRQGQLLQAREKENENWIRTLEEEITAIREAKLSADEDAKRINELFLVGDDKAWWRFYTPDVRRLMNMSRQGFDVEFDAAAAAKEIKERRMAVRVFRLRAGEKRKASRPNEQKNQDQRSTLVLKMKLTVNSEVESKCRRVREWRDFRNNRCLYFRRLCDALGRFKTQHVQLLKLREELRTLKIKTRQERQTKLCAAAAVENELIKCKEQIIAGIADLLAVLPKEVKLVAELLVYAQGDPFLLTETQYSNTIIRKVVHVEIKQSVKEAPKVHRQKRVKGEMVDLAALKQQMAAKGAAKAGKKAAAAQTATKAPVAPVDANTRATFWNISHLLGENTRAPPDPSDDVFLSCPSLKPQAPQIANDIKAEQASPLPKTPKPVAATKKRESPSPLGRGTIRGTSSPPRHLNARSGISFANEGASSLGGASTGTKGTNGNGKKTGRAATSRSSPSPSPIKARKRDPSEYEVPGLRLFKAKSVAELDFIQHGLLVRRWVTVVAGWMKEREVEWKRRHHHESVSFFQRLLWLNDSIHESGGQCNRTIVCVLQLSKCDIRAI